MAVLAQMVSPDAFKQMNQKEQERVEDWVWAEFFHALPESHQQEILAHPVIREHVTSKVIMCVFGEEGAGLNYSERKGVDISRTPLGRPEGGAQGKKE